jgi:hypothetical protein
MPNDECLINDEIRMTNDERGAALKYELPFRHSSFDIL